MAVSYTYIERERENNIYIYIYRIGRLKPTSKLERVKRWYLDDWIYTDVGHHKHLLGGSSQEFQLVGSGE